jgi:hypothetical protein
MERERGKRRVKACMERAPCGTGAERKTEREREEDRTEEREEWGKREGKCLSIYWCPGQWRRHDGERWEKTLGYYIT